MIPVRQKLWCWGGATRLRVSSQSLKRAWRTSALFEQALAGHIGIRSGRIAREAATILIEKGIEEKKSHRMGGKKLQIILGKLKNDKKTKRSGSLTPKLNS